MSSDYQCRYEFPRDRFDFSRWVRAQGPRKKRYWSIKDCPYPILTIRLERGVNVLAINYPLDALEFYRCGWRALVASGLRKIRNELRNQSGND